MKENIKSPADITKTEIQILLSEVAKLRSENSEFQSRQEELSRTIEEQGQELEQLRKLARIVLNHFDEFLNTGCHVDRCIACGKCDYEILGQALLPFKDMPR